MYRYHLRLKPFHRAGNQIPSRVVYRQQTYRVVLAILTNDLVFLDIHGVSPASGRVKDSLSLGDH